MLLVQILFFVGIIVTFYSYAGYGMLIWLWLKIKRLFSGKKGSQPIDFYPPVTLIVAAYNEADFVEEKIRNTLSLDYPRDNFRIIFITDGSTDATPDLVKNFPEVQLLHESRRAG